MTDINITVIFIYFLLIVSVLITVNQIIKKNLFKKIFNIRNLSFIFAIGLGAFCSYLTMTSDFISSLNLIQPSIGNVLLFYGLGGLATFLFYSMVLIALFKNLQIKTNRID